MNWMLFGKLWLRRNKVKISERVIQSSPSLYFPSNLISSCIPFLLLPFLIHGYIYTHTHDVLHIYHKYHRYLMNYICVYIHTYVYTYILIYVFVCFCIYLYLSLSLYLFLSGYSEFSSWNMPDVFILLASTSCIIPISNGHVEYQLILSNSVQVFSFVKSFLLSPM